MRSIHSRNCPIKITVTPFGYHGFMLSSFWKRYFFNINVFSFFTSMLESYFVLATGVFLLVEFHY